MIHYSYYADVPEGAVDDFVRSCRLARLVTTGESFPRVGLYAFVRDATGFELHLNRADEQLVDLRARPSCVLEMDEVLATIPSHWIDPDDASFASAFHRAVTFECRATLSEDREALAAQQMRLMAKYQPEGSYRPVSADDPLYAGMLRTLVGVHLEVVSKKVKFKLGQNRTLTTRAKVAKLLRERGSEVDIRTAEAFEWTVDLEWTTQGRRR